VLSVDERVWKDGFEKESQVVCGVVWLGMGRDVWMERVVMTYVKKSGDLVVEGKVRGANMGKKCMDGKGG
jgi:hypothetical protein